MTVGIGVILQAKQKSPAACRCVRTMYGMVPSLMRQEIMQIWIQKTAESGSGFKLFLNTAWN